MQRNAVLFLLCAATACFAQDASHQVPRRAEGYVPNAETAIKIAVAVWEPIFGREKIASQAPYHAKLTGNVWVVEDSLPPNMLGGTAIARIAKEDARVLMVAHGQ